MSAPAALAISKIAYPETEDSPTSTGKKGAYDIPKSGDANVVHAAAQGAVVGTQLMLNIAGNLIGTWLATFWLFSSFGLAQELTHASVLLVVQQLSSLSLKCLMHCW